MKNIYTTTLLFISLAFTMCKSKVAQEVAPKLAIQNATIDTVMDTNINRIASNNRSNITIVPPLLKRVIPPFYTNHYYPITYTPIPKKLIGDSTQNSQFKVINANTDNVIEGKNGTIIVCPKNCFVNANGTVINDNVKIELKEAFTLSDMLLENLSTTSNGNLLETDGMIYFNPTANGEQLFINKNIPIHIEIPTKKKLSGMMAYEGIKDASGKINWINPKKLDTYLQTVDFSLLDFLPKGFATEVEKIYPIKIITLQAQL